MRNCLSNTLVIKRSILRCCTSDKVVMIIDEREIESISKTKCFEESRWKEVSREEFFEQKTVEEKCFSLLFSYDQYRLLMSEFQIIVSEIYKKSIQFTRVYTTRCV